MLNKESYILAALVLTFGVFTTSIVAQDQSADDVEEVIVTGTRLKSNGFEPEHSRLSGHGRTAS